MKGGLRSTILCLCRRDLLRAPPLCFRVLLRALLRVCREGLGVWEGRRRRFPSGRKGGLLGVVPLGKSIKALTGDLSNKLDMFW